MLLGSLGAAIPFAMIAMGLSTTNAWEAGIPRSSPTDESYQAITQHFGSGFLSPFTLLLEPEGAAAPGAPAAHPPQPSLARAVSLPCAPT